MRGKPAQIYNVDETGISTEHTPPTIVCGQDVKPQAITSARSSTTTIIAAGNVGGNHVPPYYVFKGKKGGLTTSWMVLLLDTMEKNV